MSLFLRSTRRPKGPCSTCGSQRSFPAVRACIHQQDVLVTEHHSSFKRASEDPRGQVNVLDLPANCAMCKSTDGHEFHREREGHLQAETAVETSRHDGVAEATRNMPAGTIGMADGCHPHIMDAPEVGHEAWDAISETAVARYVMWPADMHHYSTLHI